MTEQKGHNLPVQDMMPKAGPTEKETLYKPPSPEATRRKEGHIV